MIVESWYRHRVPFFDPTSLTPNMLVQNIGAQVQIAGYLSVDLAAPNLQDSMSRTQESLE